MIKLKLTFGKSKNPSQEYAVIEGELLSDAVERVLQGVPLEGRKAEEVFQVVVDGKHIEKDFWGITKLRTFDSVLITPLIKSGESGQLFKQAALIVIVAVVSYYFPPAATFGNALFVAGVTIASSLALNALIPPPVLGLGSDLGFGGSLNNSQMYAISGQSNNVRRFETVPRVYGKHRVFPNVAANPYTQLEVDPNSSELIQYLYVVYDFGLGPCKVDGLAIGDTPLTSENFNDFDIRYVDFNKPEVSQGEWDDVLHDSLAFYKGDIGGTSLGIELRGNQSTVPSEPEDTWRAVRNAAENIDNSEQEIILNFLNPRGLYAYAPDGRRSTRRITLDIEFSKVGEDVWHKYNDLNYVKRYESVGGQADLFEIATRLYPVGPANSDFYQGVYNSAYSGMLVSMGGTYTDSGNLYTNPDGRIGNAWMQWIKGGATKIVIYNTSTPITAGAPIKYNGNFIGNVVSTLPYGPDPAHATVVNLDRPIYDNTIAWGYTGSLSEDFSTGGLPFNGPNFGFPIETIYFYWDGWSAISIKATVTAYLNSVGEARIERNDTNPVYSSFRFTPKVNSQYKVRVTRISTTSAFNAQLSDSLSWTALLTRTDRSPIVTDKRHVFLELRIKATGQLNGNISELSGVVRSVVDIYDPDTETWTPGYSRNPAWVFADLLTGQVNKKAIEKSRLHIDSLVEWSEFCNQVPTPPPDTTYVNSRFLCDFILDYSTTLQNVLGQVASAAQASLNIVDGKYGVLIDRLRTTPVQIFTPRNSSNFSSARFYGPRPHALRVKWIDPTSNWNVVETVVYDDGYDGSNAETFEDLTSFGCTNPEQAWRFGRYMIAQNRLRQETISIQVDFEHLVCTRGDYVQITQDVMRVGGTPARVKAFDGNRITIDDSLDTDGMLSYGYAYRSSSGAIVTDTLTVVSPNEFDLDGDIPAIGDLIVIGEVGKIVFDCLVKSISPNDDLSATITLIEKADGVYAYESTGVIPEYSPQISTTSDPNFKPPGEVQNLVVSDFGHDCNADGTGYEYFVALDWDAPGTTAVEFYSIFADYGSGYREVAQVNQSFYRYIVDPIRLGNEHRFKVVAVSASGRKLHLFQVSGVSATPVSKTTPPSDVVALTSNITNEIIQLSWDSIPDCDAREYIIRYSPDISSTWDSSVPLLRVSAKSTSASAQARTGAYFIKAIDFNDNVSENAATVITTIPSLSNLNVIEEYNDAPTWTGTKSYTIKSGDYLYLVLNGPSVLPYYSEGYYYFAEMLDLGEIYTVRLQSNLVAEGVLLDGIVADWSVVADIPTVGATFTADDWDAEVQYRSTDEFDAMADWPDLDTLTSMSVGVGAGYTAWRPFYMGDATGRIFQFRIKLTSYLENLTVRAIAGTVKADMPDRIESFENLTSSASLGTTVEYDPPFKASPNVQISIDGAESGDYWAFDSRDNSGFVIRFYDKTDTQVIRQFDVMAKGYGRQNTEVI